MNSFLSSCDWHLNHILLASWQISTSSRVFLNVGKDIDFAIELLLILAAIHYVPSREI